MSIYSCLLWILFFTILVVNYNYGLAEIQNCPDGPCLKLYSRSYTTNTKNRDFLRRESTPITEKPRYENGEIRSLRETISSIFQKAKITVNRRLGREVGKRVADRESTQLNYDVNGREYDTRRRLNRIIYGGTRKINNRGNGRNVERRTERYISRSAPLNRLINEHNPRNSNVRKRESRKRESLNFGDYKNKHDRTIRESKAHFVNQVNRHSEIRYIELQPAQINDNERSENNRLERSDFPTDRRLKERSAYRNSQHIRNAQRNDIQHVSSQERTHRRHRETPTSERNRIAAIEHKTGYDRNYSEKNYDTLITVVRDRIKTQQDMLRRIENTVPKIHSTEVQEIVENRFRLNSWRMENFRKMERQERFNSVDRLQFVHTAGHQVPRTESTKLDLGINGKISYLLQSTFIAIFLLNYLGKKGKQS